MKKILLVDDEKMLLSIQKKMLERHNYECFFATTAEEAFGHLRAVKIDLALLDINLKNESGIDVLRRIKDDYPETAVIMATGNDNYDTAMKCMKLGADDYLAKPFPEGKLVISVRNVLAKKQLYLLNMKYQATLDEKLAEQKKALEDSQTMMIQQEKLAAIGQLAAGVAHEINNPLGFITSNLSTLGKYGDKFKSYIDEVDGILATLPSETIQDVKASQKKHKIELLIKDLPDLLADAQEGAKRIEKIVQGLKSFSRTNGDVPTSVDLNECLESAVTIVWNEIKYNSKLEREFGDVPVIRGFTQQLAQVFMNLMVNASHAIEKDGLIQLKTYRDGDSVIVKVTDNGSGIDEENLKKIFDPFFTTKAVGKGTGLGMSIAREIIEKHNGKINVESTVGKGTTFTVSLPVQTLED